MYVQLSRTPALWRSAIGPGPRVVIVDAGFGTEELVGFLPHAGVVDFRQLFVLVDQFLRGQSPSARKRAYLRHRNPVTGYVIGLAGPHRVHDRGGGVPEPPPAAHLHSTTVARCSAR